MQVDHLHAVAVHLFVEHGFRVYRHNINLGKVADRYKVAGRLEQAGLHPEPCCYELHLMRPSGLLPTGLLPTGLPAASSHPTPPKEGERSSGSGGGGSGGVGMWLEPPVTSVARQQHIDHAIQRLRADDMITLIRSDRARGKHSIQNLERLRWGSRTHASLPPHPPLPPLPPAAPRPLARPAGARTPCCPLIKHLESNRAKRCLEAAFLGGCPNAACPVRACLIPPCPCVAPVRILPSDTPRICSCGPPRWHAATAAYARATPS